LSKTVKNVLASLYLVEVERRLGLIKGRQDRLCHCYRFRPLVWKSEALRVSFLWWSRRWILRVKSGSASCVQSLSYVWRNRRRVATL